MAIKADHSEMQLAPETVNPIAVPPTNEFTARFAEHWMDEYKAAGRMDKPHAIEGSRIRGSWAGKCARQIAYYVNGEEVTNESSIGGFWRMEQGTIAHEYWQGCAESLLGDDCTVEAKANFMGTDGSLHTDLLVESEKYGKIAFELKTINGFGFKVAVGLMKKGEEGPKHDHFLQGALGAYAHEADHLCIAYISQENVNPKWADDAGLASEFCAEWMYPRETFAPYAEAEIKRFQAILDWVDAGTLPPRSIPGLMPKGARITDIGKSMWTLKDETGAITDTGTLWGGKYCMYCPFTEKCVADFVEEAFKEDS